jgi:hypothetical protein
MRAGSALENIAACHAAARVTNVACARKRKCSVRTLGYSHGAVVNIG